MYEIMDFKQEILKEIDGLFQFVVMLQIFFISIIDLLFKITTDTSEQIVKVELEYSALIAVFLAAYVLFKIFGKRFPEIVLKISRWLLISIIIALIPVVYLIGTVARETTIHSAIAGIVFIISMGALIVIPIAVFLLSLAGIVYIYDKEPFMWVIGLVKKKIQK